MTILIGHSQEERGLGRIQTSADKGRDGFIVRGRPQHERKKEIGSVQASLKAISTLQLLSFCM